MTGHKKPQDFPLLFLGIQFEDYKQNVSFDEQGENEEENQKTDF